MGTKKPPRSSSKQRLEQLKVDYAKAKPTADRLLLCLQEQIGSLIERNGIALGVPMEARVKTLPAIEDKLKRKDKSSLADIDDLVGVRLILLFQRDVESMDGVIKSTLNTLSFEETSTRLAENQFGYQSNHYVVRLPAAWLEIPSYSDLGDISAEIQVRTLAQHIWAAASHKLQYKREESVPLPLRRSINRVSALLETVDLEFSRLLDSRSDYVEGLGESPDVPLNVDVLSSELTRFWPPENAQEGENYDDLLFELNNLGITTLGKLRVLLKKNRSEVMKKEASSYSGLFPDDDDPDFDQDRYDRGVYFSHVGLTRMALSAEFGAKRAIGAMRG